MLTSIEVSRRIIELPRPKVKNTKTVGIINYDGLSVSECVWLFIYACNQARMYALVRDIVSALGVTEYRARKTAEKLIREGYIKVESYNEPSWITLHGKGYKVI